MAENSRSFQLLIDDLLARRTDQSARQIGSVFEKITRYFLENDPRFENDYRSVTLWNEWGRAKSHGQDVGVDISAETTEGSFDLIQCKMYSRDNSIQGHDIERLVTASDYIQKNMSGIKTRHLILSTTTDECSSGAISLIDKNDIKIIGREQFENSNINWKAFP